MVFLYAATEIAYDGAGRQYQSRTVLELESTKYSSGAFQYRAPTPDPTLSSMTGGQGSYSMEFSHYEVVPGNVQQEIIAKAKLADDED